MQVKALNNAWVRFLSRKDVSLICFLLAVLFKIAFTWYFATLDGDKLYQAAAAKNFAEGHGITIKQVHAPDLSKEVYEPLQAWPPGYSVITAGIYLLINNLNIACFIIDIFSIIFFFVVLRKLLLRLQIPAWLINLLLLFNGLFFTSYTWFSTPTDLLTLACTLYACYLSLSLFDERKKPVSGIWLGIVNSIPAWLRYLSIPVSLVIPVFLLWNGWLKKDKQLMRQAWQTTLVTVLGVAGVLIFQQSYAGNAAYIPAAEKGLFWSNLLRVHPILFGSLINMEFYGVQLSTLTGISYPVWMEVMKWVSMLVCGVLLGSFLYIGFKKKWKAETNWQAFLMMGGLISLGTILLLGYLSLTISEYYPPPRNFSWTYVSGTRYYVFMHVLLVIFFSKWLFTKDAVGLPVKRWLQFAFLLIVCIEIGHGIYYIPKNFTADRKNFDWHAAQGEVIDHIKHTVQGTTADVIVTGHASFAHHSVLVGGKALLNMNEVVLQDVSVKRPTVLLMLVSSRLRKPYQPLLSRKGVRLERTMKECYIYSYYLEPGIPLTRSTNTIIESREYRY
jgi:hypothetical protein